MPHLLSTLNPSPKARCPEWACAGCGTDLGEEPSELCEKCQRARPMPVMTAREQASLACDVMALLEELDALKAGLKRNGMHQCAADIAEHTEKCWRALDPILANGPACVFQVAEGKL